MNRRIMPHCRYNSRKKEKYHTVGTIPEKQKNQYTPLHTHTHTHTHIYDLHFPGVVQALQ